MIRIGHSRAEKARTAARELFDAVSQPEPGLVLFFCACDYDLESLAQELSGLFGRALVVGCTTAGEIGPAGLCERSLSGASFGAGDLRAVAGLLAPLQSFERARGEALVKDLLGRLEQMAPGVTPASSFALQLIDGLSGREEPVTHALQHALGRIALVGGSAGDGLRFGRSFVYLGGRFHSDAAAVVLAATSRPFKVFSTQHFAPADDWLVVTQATPESRTVQEINGRPAAVEYARRAGVDLARLTSSQFAATPILVRIGGMDYVRSIQKANPDGSLTFYCAIEEGLVLRLARGGDLVRNLEQTLDQLQADLGRPELMLCCDCIHRRLEISERGIQGRVARLLAENNAVGFGSYGEQCRGLHLNQTLTGIAIGSGPGAVRG